jgi:hypothetical protein
MLLADARGGREDGAMVRRFATSFRRAITLARVWATTELTLWHNPFHVLLALMVTMMFVGTTVSYGFSVLSLATTLAVDASLVFRISMWNHDRLPLHH